MLKIIVMYKNISALISFPQLTSSWNKKLSLRKKSQKALPFLLCWIHGQWIFQSMNKWLHETLTSFCHWLRTNPLYQTNYHEVSFITKGMKHLLKRKFRTNEQEKINRRKIEHRIKLVLKAKKWLFSLS